MSIDIITPAGFCQGVNKAVEKVKYITATTSFKNYYSYGRIVHNENVVKGLEKLGIKFLEPEISSLFHVTMDDCVIFTAHGHDMNVEEYLRDRCITFFDLVCPNVERNRKKILQASCGIIYVGYKDHPETKGILSYKDNIVFFDCDEGFATTPQLTKPLIICQTTISSLLLPEYISKIKEVYKDAEYFDSICDVSVVRQNKVLNLDSKYEAIIIVGDKTSSNTDKLYNIARLKNSNSYKVLDLKDYKAQNIDLSKCKNVAIFTGASTNIIDAIRIKEYLDGTNI